MDKAIAYLRKSQKQDGSWSQRASTGITGLIVSGMLRNGVAADDPAVAKAIAYLESKVQKDGGIYGEKEAGLANYLTSVALMTFADANKDGKYKTLLKNGADYLKSLQHAGEDTDVAFGGAGYGAGSRPDMSNTQFFIDALIAAGVPKNDPAIVKAMKFVSRSQNLPGAEANDQPFAKKATDDDKGGLIYNPEAANKSADGLRSTGAMTYGGLKSFLYAGVSKDDVRVKGAVDWMRRHYTVDENPGQGASGLYYYSHTFAKAMEAFGEDPFLDKDGKKHDWRKDLFEALKKRQQADGSWVNNKDMAYGEQDPNLATAFALLSLNYCNKKK
jgi:squalene-hopene/tetraprenyl-beta-curcumene cyclase